MMKWFWVAVLLFLPTATFSACSSTSFSNGWTCVGQASNTTASGGSGFSLAVTYSPTSGHAVIFSAFDCANSSCNAAQAGTLAIKDNINNPETCMTASPSSPFSLESSGSVYYQLETWACASIPGSVTSFTVTCSGTCYYLTLYASEWTGMATSSVFDKDGSGVSASAGTTATVSTSTGTANANDLVYSLLINDGNEAMTVGSGYTGISVNVTANGQTTEAKSVTSTGTQTATVTWTGNDTWVATINTIKSSTGSSAHTMPPVIY